MNILQTPRGRGPDDSELFSRITSSIQQQSYVVFNDVFDIEQLSSLFLDINQNKSIQFHSAGIGRDERHQQNPFVRRDEICWLERNYAPIQFYLAWLEQLRIHLNQSLYLGLFDYECQYAHYSAGSFYKKHLDAFQGTSNRRLSTVMYLNPNWQNEYGGELVLYAADSVVEIERISPTFGTMVLFLSEEVPHEVLPATCSRYSLTGWFRVNC